MVDSSSLHYMVDSSSTYKRCFFEYSRDISEIYIRGISEIYVRGISMTQFRAAAPGSGSNWGLSQIHGRSVCVFFGGWRRKLFVLGRFLGGWRRKLFLGWCCPKRKPAQSSPIDNQSSNNHESSTNHQSSIINQSSIIGQGGAKLSNKSSSTW